VTGDEVDFEKFQFATVMKQPLRPRLIPVRHRHERPRREQGWVNPVFRWQSTSNILNF
jgi:hypothetical protein